MFGSPETTTGGKALKFYSSVRLDVRRIETLKGGTEAVGNRTRVKVVKNKVAPPFKQAEFDILYGEGISREGSLIDIGVDASIVRKSGAWYTYEGDQLGQGKENARTFLKDNPDLSNEIEKRIKEALGIGLRSTRRPRRRPFAGSHRRVVAGRCAIRQPSPHRGRPADLQDEADPEQVARTILLRRLSAAPRTRSELRSDLLRRGIAEDVADRVLDRFVEVGLVDDAAYAQLWVESRQRTRGSARAVLRQELRGKGIDAADAEEALASIDPEAERERARQLVQSKAPATASLAPAARMRRLAGMLQRRGYPGSMAFAVVREVLGESADQVGGLDSLGE